MKVFTVVEPAFKVEPLFILDCTHEQLASYLLKRFKARLPQPHDDQQVFAGRMYSFDGPPWRLVWSRHGKASETLHEVFHLVTRICADKGISIRAHNERGENDDEAAAYLFEHFARAVLQRVQ